MPGASVGQERATDPLELELGVIVNRLGSARIKPAPSTSSLNL